MQQATTTTVKRFLMRGPAATVTRAMRQISSCGNNNSNRSRIVIQTKLLVPKFAPLVVRDPLSPKNHHNATGFSPRWFSSSSSLEGNHRHRTKEQGPAEQRIEGRAAQGGTRTDFEGWSLKKGKNDERGEMKRTLKRENISSLAFHRSRTSSRTDCGALERRGIGDEATRESGVQYSNDRLLPAR
eukprot:scaffold227_cov236-Chaetoceros_neogracile.AAC.10